MAVIYTTVAVVALTLAGIIAYQWSERLLFRAYVDSFQNSDLSGWHFYGGSWTVNDAALHNLSTARGDKAVVGNEHWRDYVVETDLRLEADPADSMWGDAGVILRVSDPSIGVDSYDGYYAGIGSAGSVLLFGRANYSWVRLSATPLGVPWRKGAWFHMKALVKGCYFEVNTRDLASGTQSRLTYFDADCTKKSGAAGVRSYGVPASWRHFTVHRPD